MRVKGRASVLIRDMVFVADHSGDLPAVREVLPDVDEFSLADDAVILRARVEETMHPDLDGSVVLQCVHFHRAGNEFTLNISAKVLLDAADDRFPPVRR